MAIQERSSLNSLTLSPPRVTGGTSPQGTVTLSSRVPIGGSIVVKLDSSDPAVAEVPASIIVLSLRTGATFKVKTQPVAQLTSVIITASHDGVSQQAKLTVDPPALKSVSVDPARVEGGTPSTGRVALSGTVPAGNVTVALDSSDPAVAAVPPGVTVLAGQSSGPFQVITQPVDQSTEVSIAARLAGVSQRTTLTVDPEKEGEKGRSKEGKEDKELAKDTLEVIEEPPPHMAESSTPPENQLPEGQAFIRRDERPAVGKGLL